MKELQDNELKKKDFYYTLKLRTALIGLLSFLILSSMTAYKVLNVIMSSMINNFEIFEIINEKKEPTFFARLIMSIITGLLLFIF
jgi:Na+-transporting NADH:ubiquinone oxidoreductase subunit NqrB